MGARNSFPRLGKRVMNRWVMEFGRLCPTERTPARHGGQGTVSCAEGRSHILTVVKMWLYLRTCKKRIPRWIAFETLRDVPGFCTLAICAPSASPRDIWDGFARMGFS
jgi:hypothetical protein